MKRSKRGKSIKTRANLYAQSLHQTWSIESWDGTVFPVPNMPVRQIYNLGYAAFSRSDIAAAWLAGYKAGKEHKNV